MCVHETFITQSYFYFCSRRPSSVRKPLGELGRVGHASGSVSHSRVESFSVFEDPSQLSINQSASQPQTRPPPPEQTSHFLPHTSQAAHVPSTVPSNTTMTEIDILHHTHYEPTSTPCKHNHPSLDMTADITAITMLHDPAMDTRPLSYRHPTQVHPPSLPPPSLPPASLPPPSLPPPSLPPAHHKALYTITEESRSSYGSSITTHSSSSSSSSTANQSSCVSNLSCPPIENEGMSLQNFAQISLLLHMLDSCRVARPSQLWYIGPNWYYQPILSGVCRVHVVFLAYHGYSYAVL